MKIRLHPSDCEKYGVAEVIEYDPSRITMREAAELQRVTGLNPDQLEHQLVGQNLTAFLALCWIAVGRHAGKRPDWDAFDLEMVTFEDDAQDDLGKDPSILETTLTT